MSDRACPIGESVKPAPGIPLKSVSLPPVAPAFDAVRYRTALGVRLDGRTGNLPLSGLSPDKSQLPGGCTIVEISGFSIGAC